VYCPVECGDPQPHPTGRCLFPGLTGPTQIGEGSSFPGARFGAGPLSGGHTAGSRPTFPILHQRDHAGHALRVPHGAVPSMHSFRHTVASRALLAGESIDEVPFLLGHRAGSVTRAVYVDEVADARRRAMRRSQIAAEFGAALAVITGPSGQVRKESSPVPGCEGDGNCGESVP
jgi:hypothetical protein